MNSHFPRSTPSWLSPHLDSSSSSTHPSSSSSSTHPSAPSSSTHPSSSSSSTHPSVIDTESLPHRLFHRHPTHAFDLESGVMLTEFYNNRRMSELVHSELGRLTLRRAEGRLTPLRTTTTEAATDSSLLSFSPVQVTVYDEDGQILSEEEDSESNVIGDEEDEDRLSRVEDDEEDENRLSHFIGADEASESRVEDEDDSDDSDSDEGHDEDKDEDHDEGYEGYEDSNAIDDPASSDDTSNDSEDEVKHMLSIYHPDSRNCNPVDREFQFSPSPSPPADADADDGGDEEEEGASNETDFDDQGGPSNETDFDDNDEQEGPSTPPRRSSLTPPVIYTSPIYVPEEIDVSLLVNRIVGTPPDSPPFFDFEFSQVGWRNQAQTSASPPEPLPLSLPERQTPVPSPSASASALPQPHTPIASPPHTPIRTAPPQPSPRPTQRPPTVSPDLSYTPLQGTTHLFRQEIPQTTPPFRQSIPQQSPPYIPEEIILAPAEVRYSPTSPQFVMPAPRWPRTFTSASPVQGRGRSPVQGQGRSPVQGRRWISPESPGTPLRLSSYLTPMGRRGVVIRTTPPPRAESPPMSIPVLRRSARQSGNAMTERDPSSSEPTTSNRPTRGRRSTIKEEEEEVIIPSTSTAGVSMRRVQGKEKVTPKRAQPKRSKSRKQKNGDNAYRPPRARKRKRVDEDEDEEEEKERDEEKEKEREEKKDEEDKDKRPMKRLRSHSRK